MKMLYLRCVAVSDMSNGHFCGLGAFQIIAELVFIGMVMRVGDYGCCYLIVNHHMCNAFHIGSHG